MKLKIFGAVVLILTICAITTFSSMAADESGFVPTGPGTGVSSTQQELDALKNHTNKNTAVSAADIAQAITGSGGLVNAIPNADGTFIFEGKKYTIDSSWGQHCLTGFTSTGSSTASGKWPKAYHTVAGPKALIGKVCLVKGSYMKNGSNNTNLHKYDGIYVFEDTGGQAVEYGNERTLNVPVVDIYFSSSQEADAITYFGTIVADVYILKEIN
ncbi:MAG: hypothetical protein Q4E54_04145 [Lachnospiraceae bacterium]|nr:hypothetical protein [Lachnospiraceae bacterium]